MKRYVTLSLAFLLALTPHLHADGGTEERDSVFFEKTVAAYDNFILGKTDKSLGISDAYKRFFGDITNDGESAGDAKAYMPDTQEGFALMRELIEGKSENSYVKAVYSEHALGTGWYLEALPGLRAFASGAGNDSPFREEVVRSIDIASGFTTALYASVMFMYGNVDFSNPGDRFIVALMFFDTYISQSKDFTKIKQKKK